MSMRITAVRCLECGEVLVSLYRHDYKTCQCPNQTMIDGGFYYTRSGGVDMTKVQLGAVELKGEGKKWVWSDFQTKEDGILIKGKLGEVAKEEPQTIDDFISLVYRSGTSLF